MRLTPESFEIDVADSVLDDLRDRLQRTRWSPEIANDDWSYGTSGRYLRELVAYWLDGYDWTKQLAAINAFDHYKVELRPGVPVHFIRQPGKGPHPMPIILSHGWPWTFWDWHAVIGPLTDPVAYGGSADDAFEVIVPSLPGYGFSVPLETTGITAPVIADLWHQLMHDVFGFEKFAAGGGDWGSFVTWELGTRYVPSLEGVYLSFPPIWHAGGVEGLRAEQYGPDEQGWLEKTHRKWDTAASHLTAHSHDHQTLAWALNDSPVGLAAWILERRRNWSDCKGDLESAFDRDFLITTLMIYWVTESIGSSMQLYAEQYRAGSVSAENYTGAVEPPPRIEAPTGIGVFPEDVALLPRSICEQAANLQRWSVLPRGGHFAPSEVPDLYVDELRSFFRGFR